MVGLSGIISPIVRLLTKASLWRGVGQFWERRSEFNQNQAYHPDKAVIRVLVSTTKFRVEE
jgi:hypothetical protein